MSDMPWIRFFPSDWLGGTRGMSASEAGVYINLLAMMYERRAPLVEDCAKLARLCGASNSVFRRTLEQLIADGKIIRTEAGLWNDRVEKESVYRSEKSAVGKQAAELRWRKPQQIQEARDADAMRSQCEGNANQKPDTREGTVVLAKARTTARSPSTKIEPKPQPAKPKHAPALDAQSSDEERFWSLAPALEAKGVGRSMVGKLANLLAGDFATGVGALQDTLLAKSPRPYLAKIIASLEQSAAPTPVPDPAVPIWVTEARNGYGYPVEREGKYWRMAGALFDDNKIQVGN